MTVISTYPATPAIYHYTTRVYKMVAAVKNLPPKNYEDITVTPAQAPSPPGNNNDPHH